ncbi:hypothetical protein D3C80_1076760 [compost metagenome]
MTDRKVVENAMDARQGMTGKPVLIVLCAGLASQRSLGSVPSFGVRRPMLPPNRLLHRPPVTTLQNPEQARARPRRPPTRSIERRMPKAALSDRRKAMHPPEIPQSHEGEMSIDACNNPIREKVRQTNYSVFARRA